MLDPFLLLNLPRGFDLDDCVLRGALIKASLRWHPDRFALAPEEERQEAELHMAELNQAYSMLVDPLQRAETLLALAGFPLSSKRPVGSCRRGYRSPEPGGGTCA